MHVATVSDYFMLVILICLYFAPTTVAMWRRHENTGSIFVTNLLLGWTGLGWAIALIWAVKH